MSILVWSVWTCLLFLPSMHERYGYMLDLLLVCFAFIEGKIYYQYAVVTCLCSLMTYGNYLFELKVDIRWLSFLYVICYFHYIYYLSNNIKDAELLVLVTLTVTQDIKEMTCNLKAPIIINVDTMRGVQLIADNDDYMVRYPIYNILEQNSRKDGD